MSANHYNDSIAKRQYRITETALLPEQQNGTTFFRQKMAENQAQ